MERLIENVLNTLFPKEQSVHDLEALSAPELREKLQPVLTPPAGVTTLFSYKDPKVRQLVWEIKYKKNKRLAFMCAELLADATIDTLFEKKKQHPHASFLLLPVPVSRKRLKKRGYNQTELVANYLPKMIPHLHYCDKTLRRDIDTPSQTKRSRRERLEGVRGCFSVFNPHHIKNNVIIVLDDVTTTGATLDEITACIKKHEPKEIIRLTIAH